MITVKELKRFLELYSSDDMIITNERGDDFKHLMLLSSSSVIISTNKPIAYCNRTGGYIYPTESKGYYGYSIELDEDVFEFETTPLNDDKNIECL